ncbi:hypothetical protein Avbf_08219 [Armadillidium vulgare]|nr:hypothetical protein Avbf_08219 [Armadillidium vulgare]
MYNLFQRLKTKVQSELQKVTEQYEIEFRKGLCSKSRSSDFEKYQRPSVISYETEVPRGGSPVVKSSSGESSLRRGTGNRRTSLYHRASTSNLSYKPSSQELACKVQTLKQEFTDLLAEIRRRKSISEKGTSSVPPQAEEEDGELRKARKRTLSLVSVRSVTSVSSTQSREFSSKDPLFSPPSTASSARPLLAPTVSPLRGFSSPQSKIT